MKSVTLSDLNDSVLHVACGFGLSSLCLFIFPRRPFHISLPHFFFKGGRAFLVQAFAGESGLGLASNEKLDMCLDRKKKKEA